MELDAEAGSESAEKCIFMSAVRREEACAHVPLSPEAVQLSQDTLGAVY